MAAVGPAIQRAQEMMRLGMAESAIELLATAAKKDPRNPDIAYYHGMMLVDLGQRGQPAHVATGIRELERASKLRPGAGAIHVALGNARLLHDDAERAIASFRTAIKMEPKGSSLGPAHIGLAFALSRSHRLEDAIQAGHEAIKLMPDAPQAWANTFAAMREAGRMEDGIATLRAAVSRFPREPNLLSHLLAAMNYSPSIDPTEAKTLAAQYGKLITSTPPFEHWPNTRDPDRKLRVGYLSSDLRTHSVAFFVEPIATHHDRGRFEMIAYSTAPGRTDKEDATTARLRTLVAGWHEVGALPPAELVRKIREDRIDVLIELNGHTNNNRLPAMAQRLAPVQATYLGYPGTTGVPAIDARLIDAITDPAGAEAFATESLVRLPGCFLCYQPFHEAPEVAVAPVESAGTITFGSFNSLPKMTPAVIQLWCELLSMVAGSRLFLKNRSLADSSVADRLRQDFASQGIDASRLVLEGQRPTQREHLAEYARIDIALDTFPYNGTTTTCEALWMGVPVVTLRGVTHAGRVGASLLHATGLDEFTAQAPSQYVQIAAKLAGDGPADRERLRALRATMRDRLRASRLLDGPGFARGLEEQIRRLWAQWCERASADTPGPRS